MTVDRKNLAVGLLYLGIASASAIAATGYKLGTLQRMGPGYFPFPVSAGLGLVGIAIIVKAVRAAERAEPAEGWDLRPALAVCIATALFGALLKPAGLLIATVVLIMVSGLGNPNRSWRTMAIASAVLAPLCWLIFIVLLKLPLVLLPSGLGL